MSKETLTSEISRALARERRTYLQSWLLTSACLVAGALWIFYSYQQVTKLRNQHRELTQTIGQLKQDIQSLSADKERLEKLIRQRRGMAESLDSASPKRRRAIDLAYQLQEQNYGFKMGGRQPKDGGFDLSGFIDYILSRPEIGVLRQEEVANCDLNCLMNHKAMRKVSTLSQLEPGDLIFYPEWRQTVLYLTRDKCIGMMYDEGKGKIEIRDVNFGPNPVYAKVSYAD